MMRIENYHTHTYRCQHAKGTDREYILQAIDQDFDVLGFADHTPWPDTEKLAGDNSRMRMSQLEEYISTMNSLKEEFAGRIDLCIGLECEPFKDYFHWLEDTKGRYNIEYMIIGNHYANDKPGEIFIGKEFDPKDAGKYVKKLQCAMETGLFKYVAHPDLLFSNYQVVDDYVKSVSRDICQLSKDTGVALEYNLSGIWKRQDNYYQGLGYPCEAFWEIASTYDPDVFVGFDAHVPSKLQKKMFVDNAEKLVGMGIRVLNYTRD